MAGTETAVPDWPRGITFEQVWAGLMENRVQIERTEKQVEKTSRKVDALADQVGGLHNSFGELAGHLVAPGIVERFNEIGYHFDAAATKGSRTFGSM